MHQHSSDHLASSHAHDVANVDNEGTLNRHHRVPSLCGVMENLKTTDYIEISTCSIHRQLRKAALTLVLH
jgi:hypothetical protein